MPWAGMNEAGLMISTMFLEQTRNPSPDERPPLVSPLWIQYMLDTSASIAEVIANDARVRIKDTVDHYLVCDQTGTCASFEFLQGKTVFHTGKSMPVKALANQVYEKQAKGWLSDKLPDKDRFHLAVDRIGAFQPTDTASAVTYAFDTLEQLSGQVLHGTPTQWSIVFNPSDLRVYFRTSRNPQIRSLDFSELDLGCETPVQMLDIHAPLEGDISHKLERFSFDANLRQTLNFLNQWGANVMPEWKVEVLERGVTSFPCKQPSTPYQAEIKPLIPPVVGWAALALLYRFWWVGILVGLCLTTLVAWQIKVHGTKR